MRHKSRFCYFFLSMTVFLLAGCSEEPQETVTFPDAVVEDSTDQSFSDEILPEVPAEEVSDQPSEIPYWWDLHDYNADQEVLSSDSDFKNLSLQPGNEPDELYVTWFSKSSSKGMVHFQSETASDISVKAVTNASATVPGYYRNSALVSGLHSNAVYTYHVSNGRTSSPTYLYQTGDLYATDFTFTIAGDPEIGLGDDDVLASHRNIWRANLNRMKAQIPESSFLITTGDQVGNPENPAHYDFFLDNSVLYSTPLVPVVGNHDVGNGSFGEHFTLPNQSSLGTTNGGDGDYWFLKGNALFMVINTLTIMENDIHEQFVAEAISLNPDAKWRIIVSHYSPATVVERYQGNRELVRYTFPYMEQHYDIDLFISGHDHIYTRSYFLDSDSDPYPDQTPESEFHNPEHALYLIFNSATDALLRTPDQNYPWAALSVQNGVPQLSKAHITENSLTITTYDSDSWTEVDHFTIYKD